MAWGGHPSTAGARCIIGRAGLVAALAVLAVAAPARAADVTPPDIDVSVRGEQGDGGWFVGPVVVNWSVSDPDSGFTVQDGCEPSIVLTADTRGAEHACRATSDGGSAAEAVTVRLDGSPPRAVRATPSRPPDAAGWYRAPLTVAWSGTDPTSGIASCTRVPYAGPDVADATLAGTCRDRAGNRSAPLGVPLRYDATAPTVTGAAPARAAASSGWFTAPVDLVWTGIDATSGVAACTTVRYAGGGPAAGTCSDHAGNAATPLAASLRYDAAPPVLRQVRAVRRGRTRARVTWRADGASAARVTRRPGRGGADVTVVYRGGADGFTDRGVRRGRRYTYTVAVTDEAGNADESRASLRRPDRLLAPADGARLAAPPMLRWRATRGARFYNVQLVRGDRKILSTWPTRARLRLRRTWRFGGRTHRLVAGAYRWYVWASYGPRSAPRYGRRLGRRSFVIR